MYTLCWEAQLGRHIRAVLEMAAQSGVRLNKCTIGKYNDWDLSKMSKASVTWCISGSYNY